MVLSPKFGTPAGSLVQLCWCDCALRTMGGDIRLHSECGRRALTQPPDLVSIHEDNMQLSGFLRACLLCGPYFPPLCLSQHPTLRLGMRAGAEGTVLYAQATHGISLAPRLTRELWPVVDTVLQRRLRRIGDHAHKSLAAEVDRIAAQASGLPPALSTGGILRCCRSYCT